MFFVSIRGSQEEFDKDFDSYRDRFGFIQNNQGGESGNGLRYTSEYYLLRLRLGIFRPDDAKAFSDLVRSCMVLPGLLSRFPIGELSDQQGIDDYCAVTAASCILDPSIAKDVLSYGRKNLYVYNNKDPKVFKLGAWFLRYPALICHFKYCADEKPNLFDKLAWCISMLINALFSKNAQDDWVLSYLQIQAYTVCDDNWLMNLVIGYWKRRFYKYWPNGFKQLYTQYFGHVHPLAKWSINP